MHYVWYFQRQWGTPHYSQPATEERKLYGAIGHIKHWKPCLGTLMCYFGTNNRILIYALCVILPTGQWGTPHYSQPATEEWLHLTGHVKHIEHWKPCLGTLMCYFGTNNRLLIYPWCVILPTGQWGTPPLLPTSHWGTVALPCQGDLMCYFGTNNRLLIYPWCVILPTGQWGTPPLLPTSHWGTVALWGDKAHWTLETLSGWPDVLFRDKYAFLGTCIICDTPNRPLRNTSLLPTGHRGMDAFDTTMGQVKHIKHWKPSRGAQMCNFLTHTSNLMSAYRGDSQPASEERPLLPTGHWGTTAVWGDRAHSTLRTLSGGPDVLFRDK